MATTTTNYGFDIPQSTDLVKDGATAIATLGQDIDTAMNTALGTKKAGMVLLNTTSFSAVSQISLPAATFTATYANYRIMFYVTAKSTSNLSTIRLRTSGTDNSSATYDLEISGGGSASAFASQVNNGTSFDPLGGTDRSPNEVFIFDIINPFATANTLLLGNAYSTDVGTGQKVVTFGGRFENTTSFDSLSFNVSTGTQTGNYAVYAYNQ
jgi:hypothetical protein